MRCGGRQPSSACKVWTVPKPARVGIPFEKNLHAFVLFNRACPASLDGKVAGYGISYSGKWRMDQLSPSAEHMSKVEHKPARWGRARLCQGKRPLQPIVIEPGDRGYSSRHKSDNAGDPWLEERRDRAKSRAHQAARAIFDRLPCDATIEDFADALSAAEPLLLACWTRWLLEVCFVACWGPRSAWACAKSLPGDHHPSDRLRLRPPRASRPHAWEIAMKPAHSHITSPFAFTAATYIERGLSIIPCGPGTKSRPLQRG